MTKISLAGFVVVALTVLATGCDGDNVKVYQVEQNDTAAPSVPALPSGSVASGVMSAQQANASSGLSFTVPDGWQQKTLTDMRVASFVVSMDGKTADVSVVPLGGMAGGDSANVNRWRGQLGLSALTDTDLQKLAEKVEVDGQPADLYDNATSRTASSAARRIIGVILHRDDTTWFFKMTGDAVLAEGQKPAFISFLKSLQFGGLAAPSTMDLSKLPPSHPSIPGMDVGGMPAALPGPGEQPDWTVPAGWSPAPLSQFLIAKFSITSAGVKKADVNVSVLAGEGGGLLSNVNRWRRQLGLDVTETSGLAKLTTKFDASGSQATLVDFTGTDSRTGKTARLIGVVLPLGGQTWFYKLMGDENIVARQKDPFMKFIQSAKYPDAH